MSSSTPNKRLHEESASTEFHPLPFDQNKLPRSPLHHQMYRDPPSLDKTTPSTPPPTTWKEQHTLLEAHDPAGDRKKNRDSPSTDASITTTDNGTPLPDATPKRKERDVEIDTDRHEKRTRSDDGYMDADGPTDREREAFNSAVQQRKRMPRPRGSPQLPNRFRSRSKDNQESQDKPEVSTVVYKVGECMQELIKLWKDWDQDNKFGETSPTGPTLEVRIPAEYVTATNRQVRGGQLWGTEVYTDDSDLVAVLMHSGYCRPTASPPPSAIQELRATIRVLPPQNNR